MTIRLLSARRVRFIPHPGPEPHTRLRMLSDWETEKFARMAHAFDAWYLRAAAYLLGREPWSWASLPGVAATCWPCRDGASRHVQYTRPGSGVPWLTSERVDGGRAGLVQHALDELGRTLDRAGVVKVTAP